ncbi:cytochrome P40 monooxygenase [Bisporella sp. PMI_857]|nr:cytochrome P40 monooxygenase [Bisporella sp. PMI_857]
MLQMESQVPLWVWVASLPSFIIVYIFVLVIYRLYFHPLSKFPGPKVAAISDFWLCSRWISGLWPHEIERVHARYGDVVRIAPNDLSFSGVKSLKDIYSNFDINSDRQFPKFKTFYRQSDMGPSIGMETDPEKHQMVRKVLSNGFSAPVLKSQTPIVIRYVDQLVEKIRIYGMSTEGMNMSKWFLWTAFDIIMDLSFGESLKVVEQGKGHVWVDVLSNSGFQVALGYIMRRQHPIFVSLLTKLLVNEKSKRSRAQYISMARGMATKRLNNNNKDVGHVDLFAHLLSEKQHNTSVEFLAAQGSTLVAAGSETSSTFLSATTYYLLKNPSMLEKLQNEVRKAFQNDSEIDGENVKRLVYLNAVIEEGLRIFPPAPFGLPRVCPGAEIDGHWVPKGSIIATAAHATSRDSRYFFLPHEFHPERWLPTDHPDYDTRFAADFKEASKPFSLGPRWCIGQYLAYLELRITLTKLAWNFDWAFAPSNEGDFTQDARLLGLWRAPPLKINYTPVKRGI